MRKTRTQLLRVLPLENRETPSASVVFQGGNLTITGDNLSNTVIVTGKTGNAKVSVVPQDLYNTLVAMGGDLSSFEVAPFFRGTYALTGNLTVNTGNSIDLVVINVDNTGGSGSLPGMLTINTGNSNDAIQIQSLVVPPPNSPNATIPGRISINGGLGAENINIFDIAQCRGNTQIHLFHHRK